MGPKLIEINFFNALLFSFKAFLPLNVELKVVCAMLRLQKSNYLNALLNQGHGILKAFCTWKGWTGNLLIMDKKD